MTGTPLPQGTKIFEQARIAIERACAELRFGRPVLLAGTSPLRIAPAEMETAVAHFGSMRLALTCERLAYLLGPKHSGNASLDVTDRSASDIQELSFGQAPSLLQEWEVLPDLANAGLRLMRIAGFAPALLFSASVPDDGKALFSVSPGEIELFESLASRHLAIVSRAKVPLDAGDAEMVVFRGGGVLKDQVAVIVGTPDLSQPVLTRLHSACLTGDLFGSLKCDCGDQLRGAVRQMAEQGGGVLLYLDQEGRGHGLSSKMRAYTYQAGGMDTFDADNALGLGPDQRNFDIAANMLRQLGLTRLNLMTNNPAKCAAMEKAGFTVTRVPLHGRVTAQNIHYLEAKRDKALHDIAQDALSRFERTYTP